MSDTSIRVTDNTRRRLNRYRVKYDLSQNDAIQKLLDEAGAPEVENNAE